MIGTGSETMQILLVLIVIASPFMMILFKLAKQIETKEKDTFIFSAKNYENKDAFHVLLSRGIKSLALYLGNCILVVTMCVLLQTPKYFIFAGLFVITTLILWCSNMYYSLERARTLPIEEEEEKN